MSSEEDSSNPNPKLVGQYRGLKPWKKGQCPNPGGRPRKHHEMVEKLRMSADQVVEELLRLAFKRKPTNADKIQAGILRDCWEMMFGKPPQAVLVAGGLAGGDYSGGDGATSGLTVLLQRARYENERQAAKQMAKEPDPALTPAEQEISPLEVMLAQVRLDSPDGSCASEREVLESIVGKDRATELIGAPAPDVIVVDSAGTAAAPQPPAKPAAPRQEAPPASAVDQPAAPAPASAAEDPAPAASPPEPEKQKPPPPQAKPARRPSGFPGFDAYSDLRARERRDEEERAKKVEAARAQGRSQISAAEAFPPDPREGPEIVNFTRVPGGRGIRRVG